jgi:Ohr subfamily peroxiredoxin
MATPKVLFTTSATAHGGRAGHISTEDGRLTVDLSMPKEIGGTGGDGTNPEQLFAAGYSACFQSAIAYVARKQKVDTSKSTVTGKVSLADNEIGGFQLLVTLSINIPGVEPKIANDLVRQAHQICPYSNATRGNIDVHLEVAQD